MRRKLLPVAESVVDTGAGVGQCVSRHCHGQGGPRSPDGSGARPLRADLVLTVAAAQQLGLFPGKEEMWAVIETSVAWSLEFYAKPFRTLMGWGGRGGHLNFKATALSARDIP